MVGLQFPDEDKRPLASKEDRQAQAQARADALNAQEQESQPGDGQRGTLQTMRVRTPFHGD